MYKRTEIDVQQTHSTPSIRYMNGELAIEGKVISVNIADFLQPIYIILNNHIETKTGLSKVTMNLRYVNSSGKRTIIDLMNIVKKLADVGLMGSIVWKHEVDDDFIREFGEDIEEITGLQFIFEEVS